MNTLLVAHYHEQGCIETQKRQKLVKNSKEHWMDVATDSLIPFPCQIPIPVCNKKNISKKP